MEYTFLISAFLNSRCNLDSLSEEIRSSILSSKFLEMSSTNSNVDVTFSEELTEEEVTVLNALISIHAGRSPEIKKLYETIPNETLINIINSKVDLASRFGLDQIRIFTIENIALGITQLGLTSHVLTVTTRLINCLTTGSLYEAINEIKNLNPAHLDPTILTASRLTKFRNSIERFLAVPISQNWND